MIPLKPRLVYAQSEIHPSFGRWRHHCFVWQSSLLYVSGVVVSCVRSAKNTRVERKVTNNIRSLISMFSLM